MVNVIAHRGWWTTPAEQNTLTAFARAFDAGIGVELDVRDQYGRLVVSHDPPEDEYSLPFETVLELLGDRPNVLAVNVKSCGLALYFAKLKAPKNWFFFDLPPHEDKFYREVGLLTMNGHYVISNELLGEPDDGQWERFKGKNVAIITDRVSEAMEYFK